LLDNGFNGSELVDGSPDIGDFILFELVESLSVSLALKSIVHLLFTVKLNVISVLLVHHFALFLELSNDLAEVIEFLLTDSSLSGAGAADLIFAGAVLCDDGVSVKCGHEAVKGQGLGSSLGAGVEDELQDTLQSGGTVADLQNLLQVKGAVDAGVLNSLPLNQGFRLILHSCN